MGLCRRIWGVGSDTKTEEESRRTKLSRLHRGDQHCDKGAPLHKLTGPPRGRVAAWRARSPQGLRCTSDANYEKERGGGTCHAYTTASVDIGESRRTLDNRA